MWYHAIRIILFIIIFITLFILLKKKIDKRKYTKIILLVGCIIACNLFFLFPIENIFISFDSPEAVFKYFSHGQIKDVSEGINSCMIVYSTGTNEYSYILIPKSDDGYKIPNALTTKKISKSFQKTGSFELCRVNKTDDYYVFGVFISESEDFKMFDSENTQFKTRVFNDLDYNITNKTYIAYAFVDDIKEDYYVSLNGEKVLSNNVGNI